MKSLAVVALLAGVAGADGQKSDLLQPYSPDQAPPEPLQPYPPSPPRPPQAQPQQPQQPPYYYPPPNYYYPPPNYYYPPPYYYYPQQYPQQYPPQYYRQQPQLRPPPRPSTGHRLIKLDAAYAYRYEFKDSISALALELMLGSEYPRSAAGGKLSLELGRTTAGLNFQALELGGNFEWKIGKRVRLGFSPQIAFLIFERATRSNSDLWTIALGLRTDLTVDLWQRKKGGALYAGVRIGYDLIPGADEHHGFTLRARLGWRF
jgi:hypothetical protein